MKSRKDMPRLVSLILKNNGLTTEEEINHFLYPKLTDLPHPSLMKNLDLAGQHVVNAILNRKPILVWGDYDVDGTTATSLLVTFFRQCGLEVKYHIPHRFKEGYGLNTAWFTRDKLAELGDDFLIITVDCGISNKEEISWLQKRGAEVIITDHHMVPNDSLPDTIIVNPSFEDCGFHGESICGVAIAFYLASVLRSKLASSNIDSFRHVNNINLKHFLAYVALGTIADIVPLTHTNRTIVRAGLEVLLRTENPGLRALLNSADLLGSKISSEDIGFSICPKLNAAGRLGDSETTVGLLISEDKTAAKRLASQLTRLNQERKALTLENLQTILAQVQASAAKEEGCIIVKGTFHPGVAGIVASKLVDTFFVPAIVLTHGEDPEILTGSARSIDGVHIAQLIESTNRWLIKSGGHPMAAGLTLRTENFEGFRRAFILKIRDIERPKIATKHHNAIQTTLDEVFEGAFLDWYELLEPFGPGNEPPIYFDPKTEIIDAKRVGANGEHLQLFFRGKYSNHKGIGFNLGNKLAEIQETPFKKIYFSPTINRYRKTESWQARVIDIV